MNECKPDPKPGKKKRKTNRISPAKMRLLIAEVLERDGYRCQNTHCEHGQPLDIPHHIVFKSRGGKDIFENLITLCVHCHRLVHYENLRCVGAYPLISFYIVQETRLF